MSYQQKHKARHLAWETPPGWLPIDTAPLTGERVRVLIPYNRTRFTPEECEDIGHWDASAEYLGWGDRETDPDWRKLRVVARGCWRFDGDDGGFDIQPTHWKPLLEPAHDNG